MGALCCCFPVSAAEEQQSGNPSISRHHASFNLFYADFLRSLSTLSHRGEVHPNASSAPVSGTFIADDSACDTYHSPPRPLAYDDPRCFDIQRQALVARFEKASSHCHEDPDTLRRKRAYACPIGNDDEWNDVENKKGYEPQTSESSLRKPSDKMITGMLYTFTSSEDEDTCPICLEEYLPENPCITMQCSHSYHLGCIYEWMERSDDCPICGKVMVFEEAA